MFANRPGYRNRHCNFFLNRSDRRQQHRNESFGVVKLDSS